MIKSFDTFLEAWDASCGQYPDRPAFVLLSETLDAVASESFASMNREADVLAARLTEAADLPTILWLADDYLMLVAMIACFKAGRVAVPVARNTRRGREAVTGIYRDCPAWLVLFAPDDHAAVQAQFPASQKLEVTRQPAAIEGFSLPRPCKGDDAYLQYTSGSTQQPRGVRITHANLWSNARAIARRFDATSADTYCHWLPLHHDMGLVTTLTALGMGCTTYRMYAEHFARRPMAWLEAVARSGATFSGAPNFALERCAARYRHDESPLDLSQVKTLFCGAEPIRGDTLQRFCEAFEPAGFRPTSIAPCYGLAEATLMVSGGRYDPLRDAPAVPCGSPVDGTTVRIVDSATGVMLPSGHTGEVWVSGPSVSPGYLNDLQSNARFDACLAGTSDRFLRTGDLGRLADGQLYILGRQQDMVVAEGTNVHLCDVDATLQLCGKHVIGRPGAAVILDGRLAVIQEVRCSREEADAVARSIAVQIAEAHGLVPSKVRLVRPGSVVLTTSGKVRRESCSALLAADHRSTVFEWIPMVETPAPTEFVVPGIQERVAALLEEALDCPGAELDVHRHFVDFGLSSSRAAELVHRLAAETGVELDTSLLYSHGSIAGLSAYIQARTTRLQSDAGPMEGSQGYRTEARASLAKAMVSFALDETYVRASGDEMFRSDGSRVLDLVGGFGATLFGHNSPPLVAAARDFLTADRVIQAQGSIRREAGALAAQLSGRLRAAIGRSYLTSLWSTGAEAVEAAMRHARLRYDARARAWLVEAQRRAVTRSRSYRHGEAVPKELTLWLSTRLQGDSPRFPVWADMPQLLASHNQRCLEMPACFAALNRAFHGKTEGARTVTQQKGRVLYGSAPPHVERVELGPSWQAEAYLERHRCRLLRFKDAEEAELEEVDWFNVIAFIFEPIQAEGGVFELDRGALNSLAAEAAKASVPLIADEIQCGFGRCGSFTVSERLGLRPEYILLGKALGGGIAKLAALSAPPGAEGDIFGMAHSSTFADDDFSAVVGLAALVLFDQLSVAQRAVETGLSLHAALERVRAKFPSAIRDVRGRGCLIGVELAPPLEAAGWLREDVGLIAAGYLLHKHAIRILPTLSAPNVLRLEPSALLEAKQIERVEIAFTDLAKELSNPLSAALIEHLLQRGTQHRSHNEASNVS